MSSRTEATSSTLTDAQPQRILFTDLEGVVTKGMLMPAMFSIISYHHAGRDANYSTKAAHCFSVLERELNFKLVLITRHDGFDSEVLQRRLDFARIRPGWLYPGKPEAIPKGNQTKGDSIMAWLAENPHIRIEDTVAADDHPEQLVRFRTGSSGYPAERIVPINSDTGFEYDDFWKVLRIVGIETVSLQVKKAFLRLPQQP